MSRRLCSEDGCDRPARSVGRCGKHYSAWRKANNPPCAEDGCTRPEQARGLCGYHYGVWRRANNPPCTEDDCTRPVESKGLCVTHYRQRLRETWPRCTVAGCDRPADSLARGICAPHLERVRVHGDLFPDVPLGKVRGPVHPNWRPATTYAGAHGHVRLIRGRAAAYTCPCGQPAEEWAYDHTDPDERTGPMRVRGRVFTLTYSTDPAHYRAMCKSCHTRFDQAQALAR